MSATWTGQHRTVVGPTVGGRTHAQAVLNPPRKASHTRARAAVAKRARIARRDRRRAQRVWRLTLADHLALWQARRRPRTPAGRWPR